MAKKDKKTILIIVVILILLFLLLKGFPQEAVEDKPGFSVSFYDREGNLLKTVGTQVPGSKLASVEESGTTTYDVAYMSFTSSVEPEFARVALDKFEVRPMSGNIVWEPIYYPFMHGLPSLLTDVIYDGENSLARHDMWRTGADCEGIMGSCDVCVYRGQNIPLSSSGNWYGGTWQSTCVELAGGVFDIVLEVESFAGLDPDTPNPLEFCTRVGGDISIDVGVTWITADEREDCITLDIRPDPATGDFVLTFQRI